MAYVNVRRSKRFCHIYFCFFCSKQKFNENWSKLFRIIYTQLNVQMQNLILMRSLIEDRIRHFNSSYNFCAFSCFFWSSRCNTTFWLEKMQTKHIFGSTVYPKTHDTKKSVVSNFEYLHWVTFSLSFLSVCVSVCLTHSLLWNQKKMDKFMVLHAC